MPTPPSGSATGQPSDPFWGAPNIQPTQSVDQMTGGMTVGMPISPPSMNLDPLAVSRQMQAQLQMMEALQTQRLMQHQMSLSAFARGMPGAYSPTATSADPRVANYELQAMYQMNPYMASAMSASQGGPTMQLAPSYFQTNPRLGMFRPSSIERAPGAIGQSGWMRDFVTGGGVHIPGMKDPWITRSYAAYEDPLDERIAASRRMTGRKESAVGTAITVGMTLGPLALPMGVGATALTMGVGYAMGGLTDGYYQRRAETSRIQELSQGFSTNYTSGGFRGAGYSLQESAGIMGSLREASAKDVRYNMADYMQVMEKGTQQGLFSFNANPQSTTTKVKDLVNQIDIFMKLAGDPDVQSAIERMGKLQGLGLTTGQMQSSAANLKAFSRMAGTSVDDLMKTAGTYGAQTSVQMGGSAAFGMTVGAMMPGNISTAMQTGQMTPLQIAMHGGEQGSSQMATNMWMNEIQSTLGGSVAAFVTKDAKGHFTVNKDALTSWIKEGKVPAFKNKANGDILAATADSLSVMTGEDHKRLAIEHNQVLHEMQQVLADNPMLIPFMGKRIIDEEAARLHTTKEDILGLKFGPHAHLASTFISSANEKTIRRQMQESMETIEATKRNQAIEADQFTNRIARRGAILLNDLNNNPLMGLMGFSQTQRAAAEQSAAMEAKGSYFIPGAYGSGTEDDKLDGMSNFLLKPITDLSTPRVTSPFGQREAPKWTDEHGHEHEGSTNHAGVDTAAKLGDPIYAMVSGKVNIAYSAKPGHDSVSVTTPDDLTVRSVHVEKFQVKVGDFVEKGTLLGYVSNGGTGAHRHTEVYEKGSLVNPESYLKGRSPVSDDVLRRTMLRHDHVKAAVARFTGVFETKDTALERLLENKDAFMTIHEKSMKGKATGSKLGVEDLEKLSESIVNIGIATDEVDFQALKKLSNDDAAAVFSHIANTDGKEGQRLALDALHRVYRSVEPGKAEARLKQAEWAYQAAHSPFAFGDKELSKFEGVSNTFLEIGGVRGLGHEVFSKMAGDLFKEGAALTETRAAELIKPYLNNVPEAQVSKFTKAFKEKYEEFEKVSDDRTKEAFRARSGGDIANAISKQIEYKGARADARDVQAEGTSSSGFFMGDRERASMIQLQDTRYLGLADQLIADSGKAGKATEEERQQIAKSFEDADMKAASQGTDQHNAGTSFFEKGSYQHLGSAVELLRQMNETLKRQH